MTRRTAIALGAALAGGVVVAVLARRPADLKTRARDRRVPVEERKRAVEEAARRETPEARAALAELLLDRGGDPAVRAEALLALGRLGGDGAFDALVSTLRSDLGFPFRHLAAKALGDGGDPRAAPVLAAALGADPSVDVRTHAARALEGFPASAEGKAALEQAALADPSENVRLEALRAYLRSQGPAARPFARTVEGAASSPASLRRLARAWLEGAPE